MRQYANIFIIFILVVILMVYKYHQDQSLLDETYLAAESFALLERNMLDRIDAVPDSVKRRVNYSENTYDFYPHRASYRSLMHLDELYTGNAIVSFSRDCDNWYENYSVQLTPANKRRGVFDYQASRMESLAGHRAEVTTSISRTLNGERESSEEILRFQRIGNSLELRSKGETINLSPETKLNIESSRYVLGQIQQQNYRLEYRSEPDDFSEFPVRNRVTITPYVGEEVLDKLWVIKTEEYKEEGEGYQLSSTTIELINDRAVTLYAATQGYDGLLFEMVLNDFEYLRSRCMKSAALE